MKTIISLLVLAILPTLAYGGAVPTVWPTNCTAQSVTASKIVCEPKSDASRCLVTSAPAKIEGLTPTLATAAGGDVYCLPGDTQAVTVDVAGTRVSIEYKSVLTPEAQSAVGSWDAISAYKTPEEIKAAQRRARQRLETCEKNKDLPSVDRFACSYQLGNVLQYEFKDSAGAVAAYERAFKVGGANPSTHLAAAKSLAHLKSQPSIVDAVLASYPLALDERLWAGISSYGQDSSRPRPDLLALATALHEPEAVGEYYVILADSLLAKDPGAAEVAARSALGALNRSEPCRTARYGAVLARALRGHDPTGSAAAIAQARTDAATCGQDGVKKFVEKAAK